MSTIRLCFIAASIGLAVVLCLASSLSSQSNPVMTVNKVEPATSKPDTGSEIVLRLSGQGLNRVVGVKTKHKGIRVIRLEPQDENHLLVWLRISPTAEPGTIMLQVYTRYTTTFAAVPPFQPKASTFTAER